MKKLSFKVYVSGFIVFFVLFIIALNSSDESVNIDRFPDDFRIGVATSAYQIEGAWNESGKGESIWDHYTHYFPERIHDRSNGDIACDSYHKYKEDIQLIKSMGMNHYRFSISWPRILPTGYIDTINKEGLRYYHNVLDELEKYEIEPIVTIYHWDHPQNLEKLGGWTNELITDLYADYANLIFKEFASRVKIFVTLNEPYIYCKLAYKVLWYPPSLNLSSWGHYQCVHNMLKAHAIAYHIYDDEYRHQYNGQIGLTVQCFHHFAKNKNDLESANIAFEFQCGWVTHPIFSKEGDYPKLFKKIIAEKSRLEGRRKSKLPSFSKEWIEYIKGTADYFGLNHYTSFVVEPLPENAKWDERNDAGLLYTSDKHWDQAETSWLKIVPKGFGEVLRAIKDKYNNPPVYILENGVSDGNLINDDLKIHYLYNYIKEMLIAMKRDNCNVKLYTIWSLYDNFEWAFGYTSHFGLVHVDIKDPNRKRTLKKSVSWLKSVIKSRKLQKPETAYKLHGSQKISRTDERTNFN